MLPLVDLKRGHRALEPELARAIHRVFASGRFILGPEVARLEREFARFCGVPWAVGVASGTDALELALRVAGVGVGDLVATVSFTFFATVDAILHAGAEPLFVDITPTSFTMDAGDLERCLRRLKPGKRRRVKAVLPVHLYGNPCDMDAIGQVARRQGLRVVEDAAQAAGATWRGRPVGSYGDLGCFSFFPSKNLGGCGDGGMVATRSRAWAERLRALRNHGRGKEGRQVEVGRNSRLDELQAAILRVKLRRMPGWLRRRRLLAGRYQRELEGLGGLRCPEWNRGGEPAFQLYVIRSRHRAALQAALRENGIESRVYYAVPVHRQPVHLQRYGRVSLPETERAASEVLALPLYPELQEPEVARVCRVIRGALRSSRRRRPPAGTL